MLFRAMEELGVYPPESVVAVGDTVPDIDAGLNAGVWTVGVVMTGNMLGLTEAELQALPEAELQQRLAGGADRLLRSGAHYVVDGVADMVGLVNDINRRLADGVRR